MKKKSNLQHSDSRVPGFNQTRERLDTSIVPLIDQKSKHATQENSGKVGGCFQRKVMFMRHHNAQIFLTLREEARSKMNQRKKEKHEAFLNIAKTFSES